MALTTGDCDPDAPRMPGPVYCQPGDSVRVVEHDDRTRQPRPGGRVLAARVTKVTTAYVIVEYVDPLVGPEDQFWRETGWRAWDGMFTWRLDTTGE